MGLIRIPSVNEHVRSSGTRCDWLALEPEPREGAHPTLHVDSLVAESCATSNEVDTQPRTAVAELSVPIARLNVENTPFAKLPSMYTANHWGKILLASQYVRDDPLRRHMCGLETLVRTSAVSAMAPSHHRPTELAGLRNVFIAGL